MKPTLSRLLLGAMIKGESEIHRLLLAASVHDLVRKCAAVAGAATVEVHGFVLRGRGHSAGDAEASGSQLSLAVVGKRRNPDLVHGRRGRDVVVDGPGRKRRASGQLKGKIIRGDLLAVGLVLMVLLAVELVLLRLWPLDRDGKREFLSPAIVSLPSPTSGLVAYSENKSHGPHESSNPDKMLLCTRHRANMTAAFVFISISTPEIDIDVFLITYRPLLSLLLTHDGKQETDSPVGRGSVLELLERPSSHAHIWYERAELEPALRPVLSPHRSPVLKRDEEARVKDVFFRLPCVVSVERREQLGDSKDRDNCMRTYFGDQPRHLTRYSILPCDGGEEKYGEARVKRNISTFCKRALLSYLADALLFDALHRKDVLSGGRELHSRLNPIAVDGGVVAAMTPAVCVKTEAII
ncbi:hypothetical protein EYF80_023637 [Liparis tanakae]|uniref:Uncharacterized protein n=1 Tax=Liparis tanakae TaxID=230148 RepID=A0A4Z2HJT5_9TELE|nr:hypothetical protein EYF80_023637 [Liparis tanakae]